MTSEITGLFIGGKWMRRSKQLTVTNKFNSEVVGQVALPDEADIETALASAVEGSRLMAGLPVHQRVQILAKTSTLLLRDREELAKTICQEAGKPIKLARAEVDRAVQTFQLASEEARRSHGETIAFDGVPNGEGFVGFWRRRPVGVVAAITPFNFPLNLVAHKVAPAIAAGNAFLLKPAELTPLTAVALLTCLLEAGLPPLAAQLLPGSGRTVGNALVCDSRVAKITFTGSAEVGKQILSRAGIKKVTLELGNSSPVIVAADADLEHVARRCAIGAYAHSGQVCISVQRIYAETSIVDELRERLVDATQDMVVGDPLHEQTDVGPMIAEKEAQRIEQWVDEAEQGGARLLTGRPRVGAIFYPTLIDQVTPDMKVVREEAFGPVASILPVNSFDEALDQANSTGYGLQASVFTRDLERALTACDRLDFGGVIVNEIPGFRVDHMPYGGNKQSGLGREGVRFAIEEMTNIQTVAVRRSGRK